MLLVPALLIFTPADFFAVSTPTIGLQDKDPKEKKETEKHASHTSPPPDGFNTVPYKRQHAFSVTRRSKINNFLKNVVIMAENRDSGNQRGS